MATVKTDYMDVMLERVEDVFTQYVRNIKEMQDAEKVGEVAYTSQYIRQIAHRVQDYYVLLDEVWNDSVKNVGVKQRHKATWNNIKDLDRELDRLALESGFTLGMFDALSK